MKVAILLGRIPTSSPGWGGAAAPPEASPLPWAAFSASSGFGGSGRCKPSNYEAIGCSYRFNSNLWENATRQPSADSDYNLTGKKFDWAPNPSLFIMMHEPPAYVYGDNGTKYLFHLHHARGSTTLTSDRLKQDNQKFFSAILFVDGHAAKHDFTKAIKEDLNHPLEPIANWIWYKEK